jgi:signal transduction histidine kinase
LTICKRVVEGMGGTIAAESPVDGIRKGSRFRIVLPVPPQLDAPTAPHDGGPA